MPKVFIKAGDTIRMTHESGSTHDKIVVGTEFYVLGVHSSSIAAVMKRDEYRKLGMRTNASDTESNSYFYQDSLALFNDDEEEMARKLLGEELFGSLKSRRIWRDGFRKSYFDTEHPVEIIPDDGIMEFTFGTFHTPAGQKSLEDSMLEKLAKSKSKSKAALKMISKLK